MSFGKPGLPRWKLLPEKLDFTIMARIGSGDFLETKTPGTERTETVPSPAVRPVSAAAATAVNFSRASPASDPVLNFTDANEPPGDG